MQVFDSISDCADDLRSVPNLISADSSVGQRRYLLLKVASLCADPVEELAAGTKVENQLTQSAR